MGIMNKDDFDLLPFLDTSKHDCFLCSESVSPPLIYWKGADATMIVLHPSCAAMLGAHLQSDFTRYLVMAIDVPKFVRKH